MTPEIGKTYLHHFAHVATLATMLHENGLVYVGAARCSTNDQWCRRTGASIATARMGRLIVTAWPSERRTKGATTMMPDEAKALIASLRALDADPDRVRAVLRREGL